MVPKRSRLVWDIEFVQEGITWGDGALSDTDGSIRPAGTGLEKAVPVLEAT